MAVEKLHVVAVTPGTLMLETRRDAHCASCTARACCGHQLLHNIHPHRDTLVTLQRQESLSSVQAGDTLAVAVNEGLLISRSLFLYLLPMFGLLTATLAAEWVTGISGGSEGWVILSAIAVLGLCLAMMKALSGSLGDTPDSLVTLLPAQNNQRNDAGSEEPNQ